MKKRIVLILLAVVCLYVFTGCGSSKSPAKRDVDAMNNDLKAIDTGMDDISNDMKAISEDMDSIGESMSGINESLENMTDNIKEMVEENEEETYDERTEYTAEQIQDLDTLNTLKPAVGGYFASGEIKEEQYVDGDGYVTYRCWVYDNFTVDEVEAYKQAAIANGFSHEYYNADEYHYAAVTEDGNWYFNIGSDSSEGHNCIVIGINRGDYSDKL